MEESFHAASEPAVPTHIAALPLLDPVDPAELKRPFGPLAQHVPVPLPLQPPKAPAAQAVAMPKQAHWLHGPMPKPPEGKVGNVTAKGLPPMPPNMVDIFKPDARAKKVRNKKNQKKKQKKKGPKAT